MFRMILSKLAFCLKDEEAKIDNSAFVIKVVLCGSGRADSHDTRQQLHLTLLKNIKEVCNDNIL